LANFLIKRADRPILELQSLVEWCCNHHRVCFL
jgi:hypothetical protein